MLALGDECILGQRLRTQHVDMQIAVADVAKPDHFDIWIFTAQQRLHVVQECRHLADPHRHVVLVWAVRSEALGDVLVQPPQRRRLSSEESRVGTEWDSTCSSRWSPYPFKKHHKCRRPITHTISSSTSSSNA